MSFKHFCKLLEVVYRHKLGLMFKSVPFPFWQHVTKNGREEWGPGTQIRGKCGNLASVIEVTEQIMESHILFQTHFSVHAKYIICSHLFYTLLNVRSFMF